MAGLCCTHLLLQSGGYVPLAALKAVHTAPKPYMQWLKALQTLLQRHSHLSALFVELETVQDSGFSFKDASSRARTCRGGG